MKLLTVFSFLFLSINALAVDVHFENTPIKTFSAWYSSELGIPVVVDSDIQGQVISVFGGSPELDDLPDFVRSVLNAHGLDISGYSPARIHRQGSFVAPSGPYEIADADYSQYASQVTSDGSPAPVLVPLSSEIVTFNDVRASDYLALARDFVGSTGVEGVNVSVIDSTNSLFITGPVDLVNDFVSYRDQLDQPRPQVYIKAVFYEVSEGDNLDLGIGYGNTNLDGPSFSLDAAKLTGLSSVGASFGIFDRGALSLVINAIERSASANVLSTPQILALSGSRGTINIGQNVPIITGKRTGEASSTDSPFQTIERLDVGLYLAVTPSVLSDDSIVLDVVAKSDSVSDSSAASDIITNQRSVTTTVKIKNGQTLLLGGLVSDETKTVNSGIPLLKDIPYLGALFRSTSEQSEKRTLNVLIQATVI